MDLICQPSKNDYFCKAKIYKMWKDNTKVVRNRVSSVMVSTNGRFFNPQRIYLLINKYLFAAKIEL